MARTEAPEPGARRATRVHIVGTSTRSGTTLLFECVRAAFEVDSWSQRERSLFNLPPPGVDVHLSRRPGDVRVMRRALRIDPNLHVLHLVRDPRDVVVSRHGSATELFWTNLRYWKIGHEAWRRTGDHPRLLSLRYEDLVTDPEGTAERIAAFLPFVARRDGVAFRPPDEVDRGTEDALRGARPLDTRSIGAWRGEPARLAAQMQIHGDIQDALERLGYEQDDDWKRELDGVVPDNGQSHHRETVGPARHLRSTSRRRVRLVLLRAALLRRRLAAR